MESYNDVFSAVKKYCEEKMVAASYQLFIEPVELGRIEGDFAVLYAPNPWVRDIVEDRFSALLKEAFENVLGFTLVVRIQEKPSDEDRAASFLNGNYAFTFDTFIVGNSNKFAHAAALAVAQNPSVAYNPLFIYGESGLGKTHLLNAIKNEIIKNNPKANIVYVDGETFTNEIIAAIRENKTREFQNKYRQADVLLVDDIQFIAGKDRTQEEFFHTFNALHSGGKQIVLVSDRPPKEIKSLETRLLTRFEWGLIADIQSPDFETRCAIVKRKSDRLNLPVKNDVIEFIAAKVTDNIRQLEGVVKKLNALWTLEDRPPIMANAAAAIKDILNEAQSTPMTVEKIIQAVCEVYTVSPEDVRGTGKKQEVANARKMAMYIIKDICGMTMKDIGKEFSGRDHSTVVYAVSNVEQKMKTDSYYRETVQDIIKNIKNG